MSRNNKAIYVDIKSGFKYYIGIMCFIIRNLHKSIRLYLYFTFNTSL